MFKSNPSFTLFSFFESYLFAFSSNSLSLSRFLPLFLTFNDAGIIQPALTSSNFFLMSASSFNNFHTSSSSFTFASSVSRSSSVSFPPSGEQAQKIQLRNIQEFIKRPSTIQALDSFKYEIHTSPGDQSSKIQETVKLDQSLIFPWLRGVKFKAMKRPTSNKDL